VQSADGGVHCALEPHILTQHSPASQKSGEATNSESHKTLSANTAPSRRGRRRNAVAGRSDKADLGLPLAQRGERSDPRTRLQGGSGTRRCHRGPHQQHRAGFSPWQETVPRLNEDEQKHASRTVEGCSSTGGVRRPPPQEYPAHQGGTEMVPPKRGRHTAAPEKIFGHHQTLKKTRQRESRARAPPTAGARPPASPRCARE
jgi:hypothetical protein